MQADVSRETEEGLNYFADLVAKWTKRINLISPSDDIRARHLLDSLQLAKLAGNPRIWVDLGSGGGFPAIPLAIQAKQSSDVTRFVLIESDQRKAVFLRTAIRDLGLNAEVINERIERVGPMNADVISARALADLPQLLAYASMIGRRNSRLLFMKGSSYREEIRTAQERWSFDLAVIPSSTDEKAAILSITDLSTR
ncbi:16S rRNA (guanine(527)-N(7))-methyltransferase RsmG [Profundibacterium mesophilum]|uniref:16S rRNA (guanine(527)-N(7))-methyltransferase RsmG n=1 Tax=Profundibacterium mesophilum TaxID=1258573 RepID=UPI00135B7496|nr:16S rRNA (guanine(527)-N(7))-methyltransferase RsmG [Profundibacterium mesophilum]